MITALSVAIVTSAVCPAFEEPGLDMLLSQARGGDWRAMAALGNPVRDWSPGEARRIADTIASMLEDGTYNITALSTLRSIAFKHPDEARRALPSLVRRLNHQTGRSGDLDQVIRTVGLFKEDAKSAIPSLRKLRDGFNNRADRIYFGIWATAALARIEPGDERWAKWLADRVRLGPVEDRMYALQALAYVGPSGRSSLPDIQTALKHSSLAVRTLAAGALASIDKKTTAPVPLLVEALSREGEEYPLDPWGPTPHVGDTRLYACTVLGGMGCRAKAAIPALRRVQESETGLEDGAALAIKQIEQDCQKAVSSEQPQGRASPGHLR